MLEAVGKVDKGSVVLEAVGKVGKRSVECWRLWGRLAKGV